MNIINRSTAWLSRALQGAAVACLAAGFGAFAPSAHAQSGTLNNPSNCTSFTGFSWSNGVLSLTCAPIVQPTCAPGSTSGSFSWVQPAGSTVSGPTYALTMQAGTSTTVYAQRVGGCAGAYSFEYTVLAQGVTGYAPAGPIGTITFADGDVANKPISVSAGSLPSGATTGKFYIYFSGITAPAGMPNPSVGGTLEFDVTSAPVQQTGDWTVVPAVPQAGVTCASAATYYHDWFTFNGQQIEYGSQISGSGPPLRPGDTVATPFIYRGTSPTFNVSEVTNPINAGATGADVEISVSQCPNDFPAASADTVCDHRQPYNGGGDIYGVPVAPGNQFWCQLTPGNKYFLNLRQVLRAYPGVVNSCTNGGGCAVRFQGQGLF